MRGRGQGFIFAFFIVERNHDTIMLKGPTYIVMFNDKAIDPRMVVRHADKLR